MPAAGQKTLTVMRLRFFHRFAITFISALAILAAGSRVSLADGVVTLYFLGGPNSTNVIQATTSLAPPVAWQSVFTNVADAGGAWQFTQTNLTSPATFCRSYAR
jgi:hypothetical protein